MIEVKIVADSLAPSGKRLTTFLLTYPRFAHSEMMTHRVFSRNASSSRAIPVKKQIQMVIDNPAIPIAFNKNKPGMQGGDALTGEEHDKAVATWLKARDLAVEQAHILTDLGVSKQYGNRILEPFAHITVVCSATEYDNFFALRYHHMALPEMQELAKQMWNAYMYNTPKELIEGEWHLPFITDYDRNELVYPDSPEGIRVLIKRSVAKCARVSYLNHSGHNTTIDEDVALYDRLLGSAPIHASPAEHQARAFIDPEYRSGNFRGWVQHRQLLPDQNVTDFKGPEGGPSG